MVCAGQAKCANVKHFFKVGNRLRNKLCTKNWSLTPISHSIGCRFLSDIFSFGFQKRIHIKCRTGASAFTISQRATQSRQPRLVVFKLPQPSAHYFTGRAIPAVADLLLNKSAEMIA